MKTKLLILLILGGSALFGKTRVYVNIGVGGYPYPYYVAAPPPPPVVIYTPPPCYGPEYSWVDGYGYPAGPRYFWRSGYYRPHYVRERWNGPRHGKHKHYRGRRYRD